MGECWDIAAAPKAGTQTVRRRYRPQARPQLARIYYQQMTERGKDHLGALCVVAARLAERAWTVMRRGTLYVICDTDGRPVTTTDAKTIIAERWTVSPETRARQRSKKAGKAPESPRRTMRTGQPSPRQHPTPSQAVC